MSDRARVGIIGGGIVGSSIAFNLANAGISDVVVIDRGPLPGWGSTGRAAGGFRHQFPHPADIAFSRFAFERFRRFEADTGVDPNLRMHGYLFLAQSQARLDQLRGIHQVQRRAGLSEAVMLDRESVAELVPHVVVDDVLGASFCPLDGFLDPLYIMHGYARAARARGVRFRLGQEVERVVVTNGRVQKLQGPGLDLEVEWAIVAAGAWSGRLLRQLGVELQLAPVRRQIAGTHPLPQLPSDSPMTFDDDGFHFRKDHLGGGGANLIWEDPAEPESFNQEFDVAFGAVLRERLLKRLKDPGEPLLSPRRSWAGLYAVTPDHHPYIGPLRDPAGIILAAGFSGHGVMHSPATGWSVAQMIANQETPDLTAPYSPYRFERGSQFPATGNIY
ncbi:MAG: FAD-binding oxidoreductase [Chloroflexi bacterium]|nr:FAD-binding oxidoreductase [Chloroflexota bacterium]